MRKKRRGSVLTEKHIRWGEGRGDGPCRKKGGGGGGGGGAQLVREHSVMYRVGEGWGKGGGVEKNEE